MKWPKRRTNGSTRFNVCCARPPRAAQSPPGGRNLWRNGNLLGLITVACRMAIKAASLRRARISSSLWAGERGTANPHPPCRAFWQSATRLRAAARTNAIVWSVTSRSSQAHCTHQSPRSIRHWVGDRIDHSLLRPGGRSCLLTAPVVSSVRRQAYHGVRVDCMGRFLGLALCA